MKCRDVGDNSDPVNGDGSSCQQKLVVTVTVRSGQGNTEALHADVKSVLDEKEIAKPLKKPFRIFLEKTPVDISYPLVYEKSVPSKYYEESRKIGWKGGFRVNECDDNWNSGSPSCKFAYDKDGEKIWASQGYCCVCTNDMSSGAKDWYMRGRKGTCSWFDSRTTSHCLRFGQLWYNGFRLLPPILDFNITLKILSYEGIKFDPTLRVYKHTWSRPKQIILSPSFPHGDTTDPRVIGQYLGDLLPSQQFTDLTYRYLFVPSLYDPYGSRLNGSNKLHLNPTQFRKHQLVRNGMHDWMLVEKHLVDFSGLTCNRVGMYYEGFAKQPGKCRRKMNSCNEITLESLWTHDNLLRNARRTGKYFVENFGTYSRRYDENFLRDPGSLVSLSLESPAIHQSVIVMDISADDIHFVYNVATGKIVEAYVEDFAALSKDGKLMVNVHNTGQVASDFPVAVDQCSPGIADVPAQTRTIEANQVLQYVFNVWHHISLATNNSCTVSLQDKTGKKQDSVVVKFTTFMACFCAGHCPCKCDVSCEVVIETPKFNATSSDKTCDIAIYCTLERILDFIDRFTSTVWGMGVFVIGTLLLMGMLKMCIERTYFQHTDIDSIVLDIISGNKKKQNDKKQKGGKKLEKEEVKTEMKFALGACFFIYLPLLPLLWAGVRMYRIWQLKRSIARETAKQQRRSEWLMHKLHQIAGGPNKAMGY
ncbi:hapless 2-like isoform X2 [Corticium candelabrum]|nr:hapless 2-like isoform X2 [Corticium candelabrum]XP_062503763.1 hapless 2-like isoform X2 [Corticium candelabrum]